MIFENVFHDKFINYKTKYSCLAYIMLTFLYNYYFQISYDI